MRTRTKQETVTIPSQSFRTTTKTSGGTCTRAPSKSPTELLLEYGGVTVEDVPVDILTTYVDDPLPDYVERRKRGEILPTRTMSMSRVMIPRKEIIIGARFLRYSFVDCPGKDFKNLPYQSGSISKRIPAGHTSSYWWPPQGVVDMAMTEAKASLHSQGMDVLTFASEFHKTLAMLASFRKNLIRTVTETVKIMVRDLKRKPKGERVPIRTLVQLLDVFQSYWLEYRFGWRILYYDFKSLDEWLSRKEEESRLIVGRFRFSDEVTDGSFDRHNVYTRKVHVGYPGMLDPSKLGYSNILNTAWDVVPFSLIVDWFFNVQETILAHTSAPANVRALPASSFLVEESIGQHVYQLPAPGPGRYENVLLTNQPNVVTLQSVFKKRKHIGDPKLRFPSFVGGPVGYQRLDLAMLMRPLIGALRELR